jgi:uncharacterized protein
LSRTILVKDERHYDKFDRAFGAYFNGLENLNEHLAALIPGRMAAQGVRALVER